MCTISPSLLNLPSEIIINILSRIPIQTILSCNCVCKQLLHLLSTPHFAESHLPFSTPGLLVSYIADENLSQIFEFEDGTEIRHLSPAMKFDLNVSVGLPDHIRLLIVGSVNGLLCLREHRNKLYDALYICNPITREYIALPRIEGGIVKYPDSSEYGFGVSKISGQYKVVRNVHRHSKDPQAGPSSSECLVYTVGTGSWRHVIQPGPPLGRYDLPCSLFLNGNLHGSVQDCYGSGHRFISCFDLESESFKPFPSPPVLGILGILDECLCFVENSTYEEEGIIAIWAMKEYGVEKSWTEVLVIEEVDNFNCTFYDSISVIKAFKNGDILLNWDEGPLFIYYSESKACEDIDIETMINEIGRLQAIPHTSSFLSLKNFNGHENVISIIHSHDRSCDPYPYN